MKFTPNNNLFHYRYHLSILLNWRLEKQCYYFRFALPIWQVDSTKDPLENDTECVIVDVICQEPKTTSFVMKDGLYGVTNEIVQHFFLDQKGKAYLYIGSMEDTCLEFKCKTWEEKEVGKSTWKEVGIFYDPEAVADTEWYKLPIKK